MLLPGRGKNREISGQTFTSYDLPHADVIICSAGQQIDYTEKFPLGYGWEGHIHYISYEWFNFDPRYVSSKALSVWLAHSLIYRRRKVRL